MESDSEEGRSKGRRKKEIEEVNQRGKPRKAPKSAQCSAKSQELVSFDLYMGEY